MPYDSRGSSHVGSNPLRSQEGSRVGWGDGGSVWLGLLARFVDEKACNKSAPAPLTVNLATVFLFGSFLRTLALTDWLLVFSLCKRNILLA